MGKRHSVSLDLRLRNARMNGTGTAIKHWEVARLCEALDALKREETANTIEGGRYGHLLQAYKARKDSENAIQRVLENAFPPGSHVMWSRGGHDQIGCIEQVCYGGDVVARNARTQKVVRISAYNILVGAGLL